MGLFKSIFGSKNEVKNEVKSEKKQANEFIGGFRRAELDQIKATYKPDNKYTAKSKIYTIRKSEVLELFSNGFNPNYIENGTPKFLKSEDTDVLEVLGYFGADIKFETGILEKTQCLGWMNENLLDFYKDILLKVDQSKLVWTHYLSFIKKYREFGISFKPRKAEYSTYDDSFVWRSLLSFSSFKNFEQSEEDVKISHFILTQTDFKFDDEIGYGDYSEKKKLFVWHLYLKQFLLGDNENNPKAYSAFFDAYKSNIDYSRKTSEGYSLFDVIDVDEITENREEILKILKTHGLDYDEYTKSQFERRKATANNQSQATLPAKPETNKIDIDEEKDQKTIIDQATLDEIKATYKPNAKYTSKAENYKGEDYYTLPRHRIVEALRNGLDPNQLLEFYGKNEGIVPFMMVSHVEDLDILEQFGADVHLKTDLKNKIAVISCINFKLFDHYQDFLLSAKLKHVARLMKIEKLNWYKSKGYNFDIPTKFTSIGDVPLWSGLVWLNYEKPELQSIETTEYILNELKIDLTKEIKVVTKKVERSYLYWFILFAKQIRNYDFLTPIQCMRDLIKLIDIYKDKIDLNAKTSDGRSFYSALELLPDRLHMVFIETLHEKGITVDLDATHDEAILKMKEDPEFMKLAHEMATTSPAETEDRFKDATVIGGIEKRILDDIKAMPKVNDFKYYEFLSAGSEFSSRKYITSSNLLNHLQRGFDPAHFDSDFPLFMLAENQDMLDIFEYMGAPVNKNLHQYTFKHLSLASPFMFNRMIDRLMQLNHSLFLDVSDIQSLKLLKDKGFDFNVAQNGSKLGWKCFYPPLFRENYDRGPADFIINECDFDFNYPIEVDSMIKHMKAWFLYGRVFLGNGDTSDKSRREKYAIRFENFIQDNKDRFSIYDLTNNGENFYFAFLEMNPSYLVWLVDYLVTRFGLNPEYKNKDGKSFVDYLESKGDKYAKVLAYLSNHPYRKNMNEGTPENRLSGIGSYFETEKKGKEVKSSAKSFTPVQFEKRQPDPKKYDGIFLLELLQNDIIYFHEDEILYDGENHSVEKAWFNATQVYNYPNVLNDAKNIQNQLLDFCKYVESNPKLTVESSKIGKDFLVHLYGENLTGMLAVNLFADHFLKVLQPNEEEKNKFVLMTEIRFIRNVPDYEAYLQEFMNTVISYNPLHSGAVLVMDVSFQNMDIGEPKRKKRPKSKATKTIRKAEGIEIVGNTVTMHFNTQHLLDILANVNEEDKDS